MNERSLFEERMQFRTRQQRLYAIAHPAEVTPPRTHVNSSQAGLYMGNSMGSARPDAGQVLTSGRAA